MRLVDADIPDVVVSEIERDSVGATAGNRPEVSVSEQRSLEKVRGSDLPFYAVLFSYIQYVGRF